MKFNFSPKTKPLGHQLEAINFLKGKKNLALFDEQGLGKSKIVIDALCNDLENKLIDSVLIVCKKTLVKMWMKEILKHSYLRANIVVGTKNQRGRSLMHFAHFHIINYELIVQEIEKIMTFMSLYKFAMVLDESQKIKNPASRVTKAVLSIRQFTSKKIIITGTPIANRPEDLWSQFYFLDNGASLGDDFNKFKKEFGIKLKNEKSLKKYEENLKSLRDNLGKVSLRRTKDVLELPEKIYINSYVYLIGEQKRIYDRLKKELYLEIKETEGEVISKEIDNYLEKLLRLTQVASNPALVNDNYTETAKKIERLDSLVEKIVKDKEKVIIWTSFRKNIRGLKRRYDKYGALMLFGEIPIEERNEVVEKFMTNEEAKVLVANPSAAKEGLTLTSANNAIYLDRTFKMDDYIQSQDRIHRIGQDKKCNIIKIIAKDTIDEYTDEIIEKKYAISQFVLGDVSKIIDHKNYLTKEDLLKILG